MSVTPADAKRMIEAGEKKAAELGQPMNIAVTDAGGNLIAHARMDGAWIGSIDISQEEGVHIESVRHRDQGPRRAFAIGQPNSLEFTRPMMGRS